MQRDYVVCFLEDIYTPVERTLIDAGRQEAGPRDTADLPAGDAGEFSSRSSKRRPAAR